ncbi:MAG: hypothetical protein IJV39_03000 [Ruminococcus sp.]|nr:hypothetical protein [Ruminococcus sp.]
MKNSKGKSKIAAITMSTVLAVSSAVALTSVIIRAKGITQSKITPHHF